MIRAVRLLAIYVCRCMVYMITCRFHGFCIAANESMSEWKTSSPSMAAASNGMSSEAVIAGLPPGISSPTAGVPLLKSTSSWLTYSALIGIGTLNRFRNRLALLTGKPFGILFEDVSGYRIHLVGILLLCGVELKDIARLALIAAQLLSGEHDLLRCLIQPCAPQGDLLCLVKSQEKHPECPYCVTGAQKGEFMRTGLTKQEKTTDIWFDEKDPLIHIRTHNTDLKKRLAAYAVAHPGECRQTDADPDTGCMEFEIAKGRFSFRLTAPYSEERRRATSEAAKKCGVHRKITHLYGDSN